MRALLTALVAAFAVMFTAGSAWAQRADECGVNWSPRGSFVTPSDLEAATQTATRLGEVHWREVPGQSRAPMACEDPNDPRCHVEQGDAPGRSLPFGAMGIDALTVPPWDLREPVPVAVEHEYPVWRDDGPSVAYTDELLRPPAR